MRVKFTLFLAAKQRKFSIGNNLLKIKIFSGITCNDIVIQAIIIISVKNV